MRSLLTASSLLLLEPKWLRSVWLLSFRGRPGGVPGSVSVWLFIAKTAQTLAAARRDEGLGLLTYKKPYKDRPRDLSRPTPVHHFKETDPMGFAARSLFFDFFVPQRKSSTEKRANGPAWARGECPQRHGRAECRCHPVVSLEISIEIETQRILDGGQGSQQPETFSSRSRLEQNARPSVNACRFCWPATTWSARRLVPGIASRRCWRFSLWHPPCRCVHERHV